MTFGFAAVADRRPPPRFLIRGIGRIAGFATQIAEGTWCSWSKRPRRKYGGSALQLPSAEKQGFTAEFAILDRDTDAEPTRNLIANPHFLFHRQIVQSVIAQFSPFVSHRERRGGRRLETRWAASRDVKPLAERERNLFILFTC